MAKRRKSCQINWTVFLLTHWTLIFLSKHVKQIRPKENYHLKLLLLRITINPKTPRTSFPKTLFQKKKKKKKISKEDEETKIPNIILILKYIFEQCAKEAREVYVLVSQHRDPPISSREGSSRDRAPRHSTSIAKVSRWSSVALSRSEVVRWNGRGDGLLRGVLVAFLGRRRRAQEAAGGCEGVRLLECGRVQGALWKSERRHRPSSCRYKPRVLVAQRRVEEEEEEGPPCPS